ncbi:MAG: hypothetical protein QOD42_2855 [Sphingomonadales bacterium]|jgi:hypothetical protein|nr:hypothetical protein [Sphingomonadales bacterium]
MNGPRHLFSLIYNIFFGFFLSAMCGIVTAGILWAAGQASDFKPYLEAYFVTFNGAVSGGLVLATAITVYRTQHYVPGIIEKTFTRRELEKTSYYEWRGEFFHLRKTLTFSTSFALAGVAIFYIAKFPFDGLAEGFLIAAGCLAYAIGVYVGRKLFHIAHMLRSLEDIPITKDLFREDRLAGISTYVNSISTLAAVMVYICVRSSYYGPFIYNSPAGSSVKTIMLLPAVIAIPVFALFNYYPRTVIRRIYDRSISNALRAVKSRAKKNNLSEFERLIYFGIR